MSLVCDGFVNQATATARGLGFDGIRLAVMSGHVDAQSTEEMLQMFVDRTVGEVIAGLTAELEAGCPASAEPTAVDVVATGTIDEINDRFVELGWSDGLPVIPPTRERVEAFIEPSGHDPWTVIGIARPSGREMTVWSVAVNAVMAGCRPEHLPVLIAATEIFAGTNYGVEHSGNTTGADALMIVSGPMTSTLGFNSGQGVLREGTRANTAVGRWLRLYLRNVCGFTPDQHDKATFGNSIRMVLAEDETTLADIGWPAVAGDAGFDSSDDVLTMARINSGAMIGSVFGSTPQDIVPYLADGLMRITGWDLTHVHGLGQGQYRPLLILSPIIARTFAKAGWSKTDVREALFEQARMPAWRFEKLIGEWSNLTAGRKTLIELAHHGLVPDVFAESTDPDRLVPIVTEPSKFVIAVAGDPTRANAYVMSNDGPHGWWTSRMIDNAHQTDLDCRVD